MVVWLIDWKRQTCMVALVLLGVVWEGAALAQSAPPCLERYRAATRTCDTPHRQRNRLCRQRLASAQPDCQRQHTQALAQCQQSATLQQSSCRQQPPAAAALQLCRQQRASQLLRCGQEKQQRQQCDSQLLRCKEACSKSDAVACILGCQQGQVVCARRVEDDARQCRRKAAAKQRDCSRALEDVALKRAHDCFHTNTQAQVTCSRKAFDDKRLCIYGLYDRLQACLRRSWDRRRACYHRALTAYKSCR